jgi:hypothetical protein
MTLLSVYIVVVIVILLFVELIKILGESSHINECSVYNFALTMNGSAYIISHSGLIFCTLLFRCEILKFLHVLMSFNNSIPKMFFFSCGSNFSNLKVQPNISWVNFLCNYSDI